MAISFLVLESQQVNSIAAADIIVFWLILGDFFFFYIDNDMLCVLIRIASMRLF